MWQACLVLAAMVAMCSMVGARAAGPVTTARLLGELTDLGALARWPEPAFKTVQFSSYDRASVAPDQPGWFANADPGNYLRDETRGGRVEHVMAEVQGPGAIVRIWSADPKGTLRVYLDGAETPAIEHDMAALLGGDHAALPAPIAGVRARGYNLYAPIPFARSCKVTGDTHPFYYLVNVRMYPPGTPVEAFAPGDFDRHADALKATAAKLAQPRAASGAAERTTAFDATLAPGATAELANFDGPAAATRFVSRVDPNASEAALRAAVLTITFDGQQTVECPLGDFFGTGPGVNAFESLPCGMTASGELYAHWVMPFARTARVVVRNLGTEPLKLAGEVGTSAHAWGARRSMHFHANHRAAFDYATMPRTDWTHLSATGRGVLVGSALAIDNPVKAWWGEGDEKIYVDGERSPSWFGTGTEDFYGYAWCRPELFTHAYHAQPRCDGPENYGRTSANRWLVADRVPFERSLRFDMEVWHWRDVRVNLAATTFWYASPGATSAHAPLTAADVAVRPMPPYAPFKVDGAVEGEAMTIARKTALVEPQTWDGTSGEAQLWWHGRPAVGDVLALRFTAPAAGRYKVFARLPRARDYGRHALAVNGVAVASGPIDFYHADGVLIAPDRDLGTFELKAGNDANELTITVAGAHPDAAAGEHMFGLDCLVLRRE